MALSQSWAWRRGKDDGPHHAQPGPPGGGLIARHAEGLRGVPLGARMARGSRFSSQFPNPLAQAPRSGGIQSRRRWGASSRESDARPTGRSRNLVLPQRSSARVGRTRIVHTRKHNDVSRGSTTPLSAHAEAVSDHWLRSALTRADNGSTAPSLPAGRSRDLHFGRSSTRTGKVAHEERGYLVDDAIADHDSQMPRCQGPLRELLNPPGSGFLTSHSLGRQATPASSRRPVPPI
jgi:hypothetical protein